ncbi:MAG: cysteine-rich CWC family protein [Pseudomonadota bacterium]
MPNHEDVSCPRCGSVFQCKVGSITICHCSDVSLSDLQKAYISEHWDSCLCPQCLFDIQAMNLTFDGDDNGQLGFEPFPIEGSTLNFVEAASMTLADGTSVAASKATPVISVKDK